MKNYKKNLLVAGIIIVLSRPLIAVEMPLDARLRGGRIHYQGGRYERALEQFELALKDYPQSAEARFWKGLALEKLGRYTDAGIQFDSAFILDNSWLLQTQKNEDHKFSVFNAFIRAAQNKEAEGNFNEAEKFYYRATEVNPQHLQPYLLLAQMYSNINELEKIKKVAENLKEILPENQQSNVLMALYHFKKENWDSCLKYYDEALNAFQKSFSNTQETLAQALKLSTVGIEERIRELFKKRAERNLETYLKDSLKVKTQLHAVIRKIEELYTDNMELNAINFRAGIASLQRANREKNEQLRKEYFQRALRYFNDALRYNPQDYDAQYNLGLTYYQMGQDSLAERIFSKLIKISYWPLDSLSLELRIQLISEINAENLNQGFIELTSPKITKQLETELRNKDFYISGYWILYFYHFKKSKTLPQNSDADKIFISGFGPETIENLMLLYGASLTNLKRYDAAIAAFNQVLLINPQNQDAYRNLAVCYREKGDVKKAYEILQEGEKIKKQ
jgi:tetratricopeptide (TPR) repeat protein